MKIKYQVCIKVCIIPLLLIAIFRHNYNRINYREEIKMHTKNKKVIYINSNKRLNELFTISNKYLVSSETEEYNYHICRKVSYNE